MGNNLFPEKDYRGLGDGPIDWTIKNQKFGTALESAVSTGFSSSPILGTAEFINRVPPLAIDKWVPPIGQDTIKPLFTVRDPYEVAAEGDQLFQTKEELQAYPGYNSKIPFESGMTKSRYDALVELRTEQLRRDAAITGRPFTNIFGQVIGGGPDPSNYIPVFGQLGNAWKLGKAARLGWNIVKSGSEGAVGSTLATAAISDRERAVGNDMSLRTYTETAALGFLIGATFGTVGHGIAGALNSKTKSQAIASQIIVQSPITPQSAPDAVAVLADAYDSFMVNNGLATPFFAGGKGGPIQFGFHSQEAFTRGIEAAQKSVELNWANVIYHRKLEQEPLPGLSMEKKIQHLNSIKDVDPKGYTQLTKELKDYQTIEVDRRVVSHIIDDPTIKQRLKDSKVRDATGKLKTLFVGTPYGTNTRLDMSKAGKNVGSKSAKMTLWATDNPHNASGYSLDRYLNRFEGEIPREQPNVRPILLDMKNPLIVDYAGKGYDTFRHVDTINEAKEKGHDGVIFENIADTPHILYNEPKPIYAYHGTNETFDQFDKNKLGSNTQMDDAKEGFYFTTNPERAEDYARIFSDEGANIRPVALDLKNPMIVNKPGGVDLIDRAAFIKDAKEKGHDGVIFKNTSDAGPKVEQGDSIIVFNEKNIRSQFDPIKDTSLSISARLNRAQTPSTHYAIFDPKQIIDMTNVSADFGKVLAQQQAYLDAKARKLDQASINAIRNAGGDENLIVPKGYNYDSQAASNLIINDVVTNKFIDVLPLIKAAEKNDEVKYQEVSNKAADLDLETKTTGFEDEMELALARVPIRPEEEAFALKVDQDIAVADKLEDFINAAIKCMGVV